MTHTADDVEKVVEKILHLQRRWHRGDGPLIQVDELRAILTRYRASLIAETERTNT